MLPSSRANTRSRAVAVSRPAPPPPPVQVKDVTPPTANADSAWETLKRRVSHGGFTNDDTREVNMTEGAAVLRENALALQFHTVLLEALLTGLALAMAQSWANTVLACVEEFMDSSSNSLQNFVSSLVITAFAIAFAVLAAFALAAPKAIIYKCGRVLRSGAKGVRNRVRRITLAPMDPVAREGDVAPTPARGAPRYEDPAQRYEDDDETYRT